MHQEWKDSNAVARCFSIGKLEASAVSNLVSKISPKAVQFLTNSVRSRGMLKYIQHDLLGKDVLNQHWTSGINQFEQWKEEFRNKDDDQLVFFSAHRMFAAGINIDVERVRVIVISCLLFCVLVCKPY